MLAIVNKAPTNIRVQVLRGRKLSAPLGKHQGARLLDCMARMRFVRSHPTVLPSGCPAGIPTSNERVPVAPRPRQHLGSSVLDPHNETPLLFPLASPS